MAICFATLIYQFSILNSSVPSFVILWIGIPNRQRKGHSDIMP